MLNFAAESPRSEIDHVALTLYRDDLDFVVLGVVIAERDLRVAIRLGVPTAKAIAAAMLDMAEAAGGG